MEDQMFEREIRQKFERIMAEMEWGEVVSILNDMLRDMLTPAELAELERNTAQPAESQVGGCDEHATVQPVPQNSEAGASSQEQYNNPPVVRLPEGSDHNLHSVGILKKKRVSKQEADQQYIKKPPNAFMLFMKEQRPNVEAEVWTRGSAAVNAMLGQRWKSLTKKEQAKYKEQAQKEKELHAQRHPNWTNQENYGKKKKRVRPKRNASKAKASASRAEDKRLIMAPYTQAGVMNIPHLQTGVMEPGPSTVLQLHTSWIPAGATLYLLYFPQMYEVPSSSWQNVFPAAPKNAQ